VNDLRDAMSFHQLLLASTGASEHTQKQYLQYEALFVHFLEDRSIAAELSELNVMRVREFLVWYRVQEHPRRTRGGEVAVRAAADILKRLGSVLEENDYFETNPLRKLGRPKVTRFTRVPFTVQEVNALWGACARTQHPARDEALFLLLLDTGLRIGEACTLRLDRLNLESRQATVLGKGRRERTVPIGDGQKRDGGRIVRALRRHLQEQRERFPESPPYAFLSRDGRRLTAAGGNDVIKRIAALAHVDDAYPHRLRHTFCTWYLTIYPGDELGLRRIVGHVSRNVLADYVHFAQSTIAERAGRASLSETWLGSRVLAESGAMSLDLDSPKVRSLPSPPLPILPNGVGLGGGKTNAPAPPDLGRADGNRRASASSRRSPHQSH
jgi:integrase/recombinase XerD